jgi:Cu(I)/Ag(I) efflux system membrane fusion protein
MKKTTLNWKILLTAIAMLAAGILIGWLIKPSAGAEQAGAEAAAPAGAQIWTCSMDPQVRQPEPGKCPICGMDLIPLEDDTADGDPLEVRMSATAMQLAQVQTTVIGYGTAVRELRLNGKVQPDERLIFSQVTHLEGRVEQLAVNFTGEPVRRGQELASIYSPALVTAQEELFAALKIKDMQPALFEAAKRKLKNWKLTDQQIEKILAAGQPQERFPILADVGGIVLEKRVNLGDYLRQGMPLYDIADLSKVWVLFDVYESDMPWVKTGSEVAFRVQSLPGEQFKGRVAFIDPVINPLTRAATARVEVSNPGGKLKPEMFASAIVKTQMGGKQEGLVVPRSAVLWTGARSVVYVKQQSEMGISFRMREVELGPLAGEGYLITEGLEAGEEIAVSGIFSIDAAAQLGGKPSMMNPAGSAAATGHQHGGAAPAEAALAAPIEASKAAKAAVAQLFAPYFTFKDALVEDDFTAAQKPANELKKAFEKTDLALFAGPAREHWMTHRAAALEALGKIGAAKDIEAVREHFKPLSNQMIALASAFGPFDVPLFIQHCPMADGYKGADWLSRETPILNPYFGASMLTCGKVVKEIK